MIYIALAQSWDLVGGYLGYLSLGHSLFVGIGGYSVAMISLHAGPLVAIPASLVVTAGLAYLLSFQLFRLKGAYFALATLGIAMIAENLVNNFSIITGGQEGLPIKPIPNVLIYSYYMSLICASSSILVKKFIVNHRIGIAALSIREDEHAAQQVGINVVTYKSIMLVISAALTGFAGGSLALFTSYVHPEVFFGVRIGLVPVVASMLGGSGTLLGPTVGAALLALVQEALWSSFQYLHLAMLGLMFVVVGAFMPRGLVGLASNRKLKRVMGVVRSAAKG